MVGGGGSRSTEGAVDMMRYLKAALCECKRECAILEWKNERVGSFCLVISS